MISSRLYAFRSLLVRNQFNFCIDVNVLKRQKEAKLAQIIQQKLNTTYLSIKDTTVSSSQCGQMYKFVVESPLFSGKSKVEQHQMVTAALGDEIKNIHGFNLKTRAPEAAAQQTKPETTGN